MEEHESTANMDVDEDDDFYAPSEAGSPKNEVKDESATATPAQPEKVEQEDADLEEGEEAEEEEEDEEDSDSDIDIITERKDGSKAVPPTQAKFNEIRNIPQRTTSTDVPTKIPAVKKEESKDSKKASTAQPSSELPAQATSKIDVHAKPIYTPAGKPITQVNIDEDLPDNDKPWRRPGADISDYFNYGFDEFTWALYASKQEALRSEYDQNKIAQNNKKMFEDLNMMMMGGMPVMPGMPAAGGAAMPGMPTMDGMPAEMQQMMQQMMQSGMDPSQMDPSMFGAMASGQPAAQGGNAGQGQGFGQQGFGQGQGQMGYGFDQNMMGAGGNQQHNRGGFGNRGRGAGRGRW